jgi:import inner membrane translocase subunit TIM23
MPWNTYFKLRKSRSTFGTISAIPTTIAGMALGGGYFANLESEPGQLILGFEPIIVCTCIAHPIMCIVG